MKKTNLLLLILMVGMTQLRAQTASFNFTQYPVSISGWNNIYGNPAAAVCSGTDATTGISVSSIGAANWSPYTNGVSAYDSGGISGGTFFPAGVMLNHWFQYNNPATADYNGAIPQLKISGLATGSVYTIRMTGSYGTYFNEDPTQYTVLGAKPYGYVDVNNNNNTANGAVFNNVSPDATGSIYVYVNTVSTTQVADICGIQIISGSSGTYPTVSITNPLNNAGLSEDGTVTLTATASESGGSISRVEFYVDTTLIGTATAAPYSVRWSGADPGLFTIIANAVDANGNSNASAINVNVQSLNYYWSTTGNIGNNGDSNFIGNVDSVRLGFRTKNIERLSISPNGYVGIGTTTPAAQLHTTGTVRHAGLTNDSTKTRVLVTDTSGNLFYRNASGISGPWQYVNGVVYDSADAIAIGTSNPQGYKLAVNGTAIFTKVKVKTAGTWPDYVFLNGYTPPDLKKLEVYLRTYHHLPGIVSEAEVQQNGIDVGDQQAAVLKKVEELTLYLIEQNKTLTEQNRQLQDQNARLQDQQRQIDELKKLLPANKK